MTIEMSEPVPVDTIISDLAKAVSQATDRALALARFTDDKAVEAVVEKAVEKALEERALDETALDEVAPNATVNTDKAAT
jgi:uncharacterized membrane-anchored protein YjiN (DUF445 family)